MVYEFIKYDGVPNVRKETFLDDTLKAIMKFFKVLHSDFDNIFAKGLHLAVS